MAKDLQVKVTYKAEDRASKVMSSLAKHHGTAYGKMASSMRRVDALSTRLAKGLTKGLVVGATAVSGAAIGVFHAMRKTADSMDDLAKKTRAINFPIEEFQEWRFVSEQSGIASDKFDKSMSILDKRVGKLKAGFGPLYAVLKKNDKGLLNQLKTTNSSAEAMELLIAAMQKKPDAMQTVLADAAFGLTKMSLLSKNTTKQIKDLRNEMRQNGLVTADQAAKAEAFNDALISTSKAIKSALFPILTDLMPIVTDVTRQIRDWSVANRGLITDKFKKGLTWLVDNFKDLVYWGKKIAVGIGVFYGLTAAIKVTTVAMNLFNASSKFNLVPAKAFGQYMGGTLPKQINKGTLAVGALQTAMVGVGAFVAGWEVGTILHEKLVEPFMKARHEAEMLEKEHKQTMAGDLSKRNSAMLKSDIKRAEKVIENKETETDLLSTLSSSIAGGMAGYGPKIGKLEVKSLKGEKTVLKSEESLRRRQEVAKQQITDEWSTESVVTPLTRQETTNLEKFEILIKDDSGRAEITKGKKSKSKNKIELRHSGGMRR